MSSNAPSMSPLSFWRECSWNICSGAGADCFGNRTSFTFLFWVFWCIVLKDLICWRHATTDRTALKRPSGRESVGLGKRSGRSPLNSRCEFLVQGWGDSKSARISRQSWVVKRWLYKISRILDLRGACLNWLEMCFYYWIKGENTL